jgi:acetyl-CoA carboxylase biotin carboxyl carrier protein
MSEAMIENRESVQTVLDAVRRSAHELLAEVPNHPSVVRVRAGDVAIELEWAATETIGTIEVSGAPAHTSVTAVASYGAGSVDATSNDPLYDICAPTVGVFYRSAQPGSSPFVQEGDLVEMGQQVGILEAMKIMIPVEADRTGRIFAVLKPNGAQVEYGEPLFAIEPLD